MLDLTYTEVRGLEYSPELDEWQARGILETLDEVAEWEAHRRPAEPGRQVQLRGRGELLAVYNHEELKNGVEEELSRTEMQTNCAPD